MADRIDDDLRRGCLRQPILMDMRRRRRWIGAPDHHAVGSIDRARVEATRRFAIHQLQRRMACLVAHRVRVDLGGADAVKEAQGKSAGNQRACSGVVRMQNRSCAIAATNGVESIGDGGEGLVPACRLEASGALRSDAPQWACQAHAGIAPDPVIANRAFAAQSAAADVVVGIANDVDAAVRGGLHQHAARIVTVARTGGADDRGVQHRAVSSTGRHCTNSASSQRARI